MKVQQKEELVYPVRVHAVCQKCNGNLVYEPSIIPSCRGPHCSKPHKCSSCGDIVRLPGQWPYIAFRTAVIDKEEEKKEPPVAPLLQVPQYPSGYESGQITDQEREEKLRMVDDFFKTKVQ